MNGGQKEKLHTASHSLLILYYFGQETDQNNIFLFCYLYCSLNRASFVTSWDKRLTPNLNPTHLHRVNWSRSQSVLSRCNDLHSKINTALFQSRCHVCWAQSCVTNQVVHTLCSSAAECGMPLTDTHTHTDTHFHLCVSVSPVLRNTFNVPDTNEIFFPLTDAETVPSRVQHHGTAVNNPTRRIYSVYPDRWRGFSAVRYLPLYMWVCECILRDLSVCCVTPCASACEVELHGQLI